MTFNNYSKTLMRPPFVAQQKWLYKQGGLNSEFARD